MNRKSRVLNKRSHIKAEFPYLFGEHIWSWGPVKIVFEPSMPPLELVSNINIAPFDNDGWLIIRQQQGGGLLAVHWSRVNIT